jgi:RNA polymerase sigma-70 factor, ECF subfamily
MSAGEAGAVMTVREEGARAQPRAASALTFEVFYEVHWARTVTVTGVLCRDMAIAEELAQEAFLRAYGRWKRVSSLDRPELWVQRVALNLAVSRFRRLQAETRALGRARADQRPAPASWSSPEVEEFWTALRSLPTKQAQVAALYYVDDLSVARIAELLGCADGTVKAHLHAARARLRVVLDHPREDER